MSARAEKPITVRERDLLAAIIGLIDLPNPASYDERQGYYDTLSERAAWLSGALENAVTDPGHYLSTVTETCRHFAAQPLRYVATPTPEPATARLADSLGLRQLPEAQGITAEPEAGQ